jgi:hypothetical protein
MFGNNHTIDDSTDPTETTEARCGFCGDLGCELHDARGTETDLIEFGVDDPTTPDFR